MIEFTVSSNIKSVGKTLISMEKAIANFSVPLKQSGLVMMRSIDENFREEGRPEKWKPLKPATIAGRRKKGKGGVMILQDDGILKGSITPRQTKDTVAIGTSVPYGKVHQFGTAKVPQRKFLLFQESDIKTIEKIFEKHADKSMKTSIEKHKDK